MHHPPSRSCVRARVCVCARVRAVYVRARMRIFRMDRSIDPQMRKMQNIPACVSWVSLMRMATEEKRKQSFFMPHVMIRYLMRYLRWYESLRTKTETGIHIKKVRKSGGKREGGRERERERERTKKKKGYNVHEIADDVPVKATHGSEARIRKKKKKKKKKKKGRKRQTREKMREEILISKIFTLVKLDAATMTHDDLFGIDYH